jgi:glycosyltransferase involved in cell wall biosynthesis
MEALASGTPLVATTAGGIGGVVEDGRTGVLVPERDTAALARAIAALLAEPTRRQALADAARSLVAERFGWARAAQRFESAYDRALAFNSLTK